MHWIINNIEELVTFLAAQSAIYAPVGDDSITFKKIDKAAEINLKSLSTFSVRNYFQPPTHYFLKYKTDAPGNTEFADFNTAPGILFGLRPCDLKGIGILDNIFQASTSYNRLREKTLIVGMLCETETAYCFCKENGVDPLSASGMDMVLIRTGERYQLTVLSAMGKSAMADARFKIAENPVIPGTGKGSGNLSLPDKVIESIPAEKWEAWSFACINCRVCTFVCPTCHCFTISDRQFQGEGGRAVVWDSCQDKSFCKEASGYNPRQEKFQRFKNRILHKFNFYRTNYGESMCTGCGRCIKHCPQGLSIRDMVKTIINHRESDND